MKRLTQTYHIRAPLASVWYALVDPDILEEWGAGPADMSEQEGAEFSLWGGDIHGLNIKVVPQTLLVQDWFSDGWPEPSKLTLHLFEKKGITTIELVHEQIPDRDVKDIAQGWKDYYFGPLTQHLETSV